MELIQQTQSANMELKDQIRIAREAKDWDIETLADKLKVSVTSVKFWEQGKGPKRERIKDIEGVLETTFNVTGTEKIARKFPLEIEAAADVLTSLPRVNQDIIIRLIYIMRGGASEKLTPSRSVTKRNESIKSSMTTTSRDQREGDKLNEGTNDSSANQ